MDMTRGLETTSLARPLPAAAGIMAVTAETAVIAGTRVVITGIMDVTAAIAETVETLAATATTDMAPPPPTRLAAALTVMMTGDALAEVEALVEELEEALEASGTTLSARTSTRSTGKIFFFGLLLFSL